MYVVNRLSSHVSDPSATAFQIIKNLIRCLSVFPHLHIMFITGIDGNTIYDHRQELYPGKLYPQKISNGLVGFVDVGDFRAANEKSAISCVILFIFGVAVH